MQQLGYSSGSYLFRSDDLAIQMDPSELKVEGTNTLELMFHKDMVGDQAFYDRMRSLDLTMFTELSMHAPNIQYGQNPEAVEAIDLMKELAELHNIRYVVVHPDIVSDWTVFNDLKDRVLIENMDASKTFGQTVEDMRTCFERFDTGMVLDIQHIYSIDPSMSLLDEMVAAFKDRIKEIHISGYELANKFTRFSKHVSLKDKGDQQKIIGEQLRKLSGVRTILEAGVLEASREEDMEAALIDEVRYVRSFIE